MTFAEWWQAEGMLLFSENPMVLRSSPHEIASKVWDAGFREGMMHEYHGFYHTPKEEPEEGSVAIDVEFKVIPEGRRIGAG